MSDDVIRLSDLVPEYARHYKASPQEASYALHELILDLYSEYHVKREEMVVPHHIFWVGRVGGSQLSTKSYKLFFNGLIDYFNNLFSPLPEVDDGLVRCYCVSDSGAKDIPAGIVYLSRAALGKWVLDAGIEPPDFILSTNAGEGAEKDKRWSEFKEQELGTISKIMNGLVDLIKEVDKAHREPPTDSFGRKRAEKIKIHASRLNNPPRKNFDMYSALISFAEDAEVDIPTDHQTLRKYMRAQSKPNRSA
ncbi:MULTISPECIES: hypothetical protein [Pseudomonas]|uniref:hypothetical protein n=1 Tax=Pseudomonas TaxID=286 RepID=UPI000642768F|nr:MULTISPECIES: hypothetical protein [Pseudomonas]MBP3860815.1 hypothetical protein [Pseudomonas sp.]MCT8953329.1 hypothetical protein [Pseudomonas lundensis]MDN5391508.1 hypothetical protein [Pseudomonas sp.]MDN5393720.1 hypothetical protein [Pseudomonas sp.]MDN5406052.1 hypothetical protein [Pseudomonas sp.]